MIATSNGEPTKFLATYGRKRFEIVINNSHDAMTQALRHFKAWHEPYKVKLEIVE